MRRLPARRSITSPASFSTFRCWETAGRLTGSSAASSPTARGRSARRSKIARRVGSPSAVSPSVGKSPRTVRLGLPSARVNPASVKPPLRPATTLGRASTSATSQRLKKRGHAAFMTRPCRPRGATPPSISTNVSSWAGVSENRLYAPDTVQRKLTSRRPADDGPAVPGREPQIIPREARLPSHLVMEHSRTLAQAAETSGKGSIDLAKFACHRPGCDEAMRMGVTT